MTDMHSARYAHALDFAETQVAATIERTGDYFPIYSVGGRWHHDGELWTDWTGGFFAGLMWQFAHRAGAPQWRERAEHFSRLLEHRQHDRNVHDLGFIFLNTYRPWHELTGDDALRQVLIQAGRTLAMRFQEKGQYLCSFIGPQSLFIDIMMNVPIIFYAARETSDANLLRIAEAHCRTTRDTLVRPDGSTAHEGIFDLETGQFLRQSTHQGLHPDSNWARGLAWSLYGYSQAYALSGNEEFLAVAERNADFWLTHLPPDHVAYWDFSADLAAPLPWGPQKDSSATAIAASGLLDLERQTRSTDRAVIYRQTALAMLDALTDSKYLADQTPGWEGILKHGVYHTAKGLGVDESVMWGDFFLVEALMKVVAPPAGYTMSMKHDSSTPVRIAFLGADAQSLALAQAAIASHHYDLAGVCEIDLAPDREIGDAFQNLARRSRHFDHWEALLDQQVVDAVVVARGIDDDLRAEQLRKLIQAGVPVLVSHPVVESMLIYYELDMIRRETGCVALPCMPERSHPAIVQLAQVVREGAQSPIGQVEQLIVRRALTAPDKRNVISQFARDVDLVRAVAGDMTRLGAMAGSHEAPTYGSLGVQMSGPGGIATRWSVDPTPGAARAEITLVGSRGSATVALGQENQPWTIQWSVGGKVEQHTCEAWDPAAAALDHLAAAMANENVSPDWVDASRSIELAETIDRSLKKGRTIELYYEDYTEQGTFKGTMTSLGCGLLLFGMAALAIVAIGEQIGLPFVRAWPYVLLAAFVAFLLLQLLMLVFRNQDPPADSTTAELPASHPS